MAAKVANKAKGRFIEWAAPLVSGWSAQTFKAMLLTTSESLAAIQDYASLGAMLAASGGAANVECAGGGYARQTLTGIAVVTDNTGDKETVDSDDVSFGAILASAGITKAVIYLHQAGGDNNCVICAVQDYVITPDGSTLADLINVFAEAD